MAWALIDAYWPAATHNSKDMPTQGPQRCTAYSPTTPHMAHHPSPHKAHLFGSHRARPVILHRAYPFCLYTQGTPLMQSPSHLKEYNCKRFQCTGTLTRGRRSLPRTPEACPSGAGSNASEVDGRPASHQPLRDPWRPPERSHTSKRTILQISRPS